MFYKKRPKLDWHETDLKLKIELYKLSPTNLGIKQVAFNNSHIIKRENESPLTNNTSSASSPQHHRINNTKKRYEIALLSTDLINVKLKLKIAYVKTVFPSSLDCVALLRFVPNETTRNDYDLNLLVERVMSASGANNCYREVVLLPKYLELIGYLSTNKNLFLTSNQENKDCRQMRGNLVTRVYECFIRTIQHCSKMSNFEFYLLQSTPQQVVLT